MPLIHPYTYVMFIIFVGSFNVISMIRSLVGSSYNHLFIRNSKCFRFYVVITCHRIHCVLHVVNDKLLIF